MDKRSRDGPAARETTAMTARNSLNIGAPGRIRTHDPLVRSFEINQPSNCFLTYFRYVRCSMFAHPCPGALKKSRKSRARISLLDAVVASFPRAAQQRLVPTEMRLQPRRFVVAGALIASCLRPAQRRRNARYNKRNDGCRAMLPVATTT